MTTNSIDTEKTQNNISKDIQEVENLVKSIEKEKKDKAKDLVKLVNKFNNLNLKNADSKGELLYQISLHESFQELKKEKLFIWISENLNISMKTYYNYLNRYNFIKELSEEKYINFYKSLAPSLLYKAIANNKIESINKLIESSVNVDLEDVRALLETKKEVIKFNKKEVQAKVENFSFKEFTIKKNKLSIKDLKKLDKAITILEEFKN